MKAVRYVNTTVDNLPLVKSAQPHTTGCSGVPPGARLEFYQLELGDARRRFSMCNHIYNAFAESTSLTLFSLMPVQSFMSGRTTVGSRPKYLPGLVT